MGLTSHSSNHRLPVNFLSGKGELYELTKSFPWHTTGLGDISDWPAGLRTTVNIILNSKFPMFLWWGPDLIQFYNDAYRPSLGNNGKHPAALGQRGQDCWPEIWPVIKPLIDQVLTTREPAWSEDQLIPIYRNGALEDVYWTFSYSAVLGDDGNVDGVLVVCTETTDKLRSLRELKNSEDELRFAVEAAELATFDYDPLTNKFTANARLKEWFGLPDDASIDLPLALAVIAGKDRNHVASAIQQSLQPASGGRYEVLYTIIHPLTGQERIVRAKGKCSFNDSGVAYRLNGTLQDITADILSRSKIEEERNRSRLALEAGELGLFEVDISTNHLIADHKFNEIYGFPHTVSREQYVATCHPEDRPIRDAAIANSLITGSFDYVTRFFHQSGAERYLRAKGNITYRQDKVPYKMYGVIQDITDQVLSHKIIRESEQRFRSMIERAPVAMALTRGREMIVEVVNEHMLGLINAGPEAIGKPLLDILPELKGQAVVDILHRVFDTGTEFKARELEIAIGNDDRLEKRLFDLNYTPLFDDGTAAVLHMMTDVTTQVQARKKIEKAEARTRNMAERLLLAIDAGNLGTYELILKTNEITCNDRCREMFELAPAELFDYEKFLALVVPDDREYVRHEVNCSLSSNTVYNADYRIKTPSGAIRWIRASGRPIYDDNKPVLMSGVTIDITAQMQFAEELSRQVNERTRELQTSNNDLLQFAHVISHDLREPVRKIKTFHSRILDEYASLLPGKVPDYLGRINNSADRMASMIEGVLHYSTLNATHDALQTVSLTDILRQIEHDLEIPIQQKQARLLIEDLPEIEGTGILIYQLFYNLLNNSLKFSAPGRPLEIAVRGTLIIQDDSPWVRIVVSDNGIGFDNQYAGRIFNTFSRLHSKDAYEGTGLGLALCQKIVIRHHGVIEASGQENNGASFTITLPLRQPQKTDPAN